MFGRLVLDPSRQRGNNAVPYILAPLSPADADVRARYIAYRLAEAQKAAEAQAVAAAPPAAAPAPTPTTLQPAPSALDAIAIATGPTPW